MQQKYNIAINKYANYDNNYIQHILVLNTTSHYDSFIASLWLSYRAIVCIW